MLEELKQKVCQANRLLPEYGLVLFTWGNVSGIDRESGLVVIKPSGVEYDALTPESMAVVDLWTGEQREGDLRPSSDTPTHLALYRAFGDIGGVAHTHSRWATVFAQAGLGIPPLGTTHADTFRGQVPCTRSMTPEEIGGEAGHYEAETGKVIAEAFAGKNPKEIPAALVRSHGPFVWGKDPRGAADTAAVLEEVACMAWQNLLLDRQIPCIPRSLLDRHFLRKHGDGAYYGQNETR